MSTNSHMQKRCRIALVLGGGGVKGLAHIPLLKLLDELALTPVQIIGTSMGAILGALYASGVSGSEIEARIRAHTISRGDGAKALFERRRQLLNWTRVFRFEKNRGGLLNAEGLFEHLFAEIVNTDFADLTIPFTAIATHFHTGTETAFSSGNLLSAVKASMAVPGVFAPVEIDGELYVDGGLVNNLPVSHVPEDLTAVASDVISLPTHESPSTSHMLSGALGIMLTAATAQQLKMHPPACVFKPDTKGIDVFDFHKINAAMLRGEAAVDNCRQDLKRLFLTPEIPE